MSPLGLYDILKLHKNKTASLYSFLNMRDGILT